MGRVGVESRVERERGRRREQLRFDFLKFFKVKALILSKYS
jgi:hypothetical protein